MKTVRSYRLDSAVSVHIGDARAALRALPPESVDVCVTSPPYFGLRDYHVTPSVWGGDAGCRHAWDTAVRGRRKDLLPEGFGPVWAAVWSAAEQSSVR